MLVKERCARMERESRQRAKASFCVLTLASSTRMAQIKSMSSSTSRSKVSIFLPQRYRLEVDSPTSNQAKISLTGVSSISGLQFIPDIVKLVTKEQPSHWVGSVEPKHNKICHQQYRITYPGCNQRLHTWEKQQSRIHPQDEQSQWKTMERVKQEFKPSTSICNCSSVSE